MAGRKIGGHSEEWWSAAPTHVLRCTGQKPSTGERCRREAILGGTVCHIHGGRLPAVQQAAATRIGMSVDDAVKRLLAMLDDPDVETRDKTKILHDLLDRGGLGATSKVLVGIASQDPIETLFRDILSDPNGLAPAEPLPASKRLYDDGEDSPLLALESSFSGFNDVIDAEVIEEPAREQHTIDIGATSSKPPKHIRQALERLL